jgi:hypothetical protein
MTLTEHALRGSVLRAGADHRLEVGLPWYRAMPYSSIVDLALSVDGRQVDDLRLDIGDRWAEITELATLTDRTWFLQDRHELGWRSAEALGGRATVVLRIRLHLPFLVGPDGGSVQVLQEVRADVAVEPA